MNYVDIALITFCVILILSGMLLGVNSQFLFPLISGLFGASLLCSGVANKLNFQNIIMVLIIYVVLTILVSGLTFLIFKILSLSRNSKVLSRITGSLVACVSVAFLLVATSRSVPIFQELINGEVLELLNESLIIKYIK